MKYLPTILILLAGCSAPNFTASLKQSEATLAATPVIDLVTPNQMKEMKQMVVLMPVVAAVKKTGNPSALNYPINLPLAKIIPASYSNGWQIVSAPTVNAKKWTPLLMPDGNGVMFSSKSKWTFNETNGAFQIKAASPTFYRTGAM